MCEACQAWLLLGFRVAICIWPDCAIEFSFATFSHHSVWGSRFRRLPNTQEYRIYWKLWRPFVCGRRPHFTYSLKEQSNTTSTSGTAAEAKDCSTCQPFPSMKSHECHATSRCFATEGAWESDEFLTFVASCKFLFKSTTATRLGEPVVFGLQPCSIEDSRTT